MSWNVRDPFLPFLYPGSDRNLAAQIAERASESDGEAHGVGIAVVQGHHFPQAELIVGEIR